MKQLALLFACLALSATSAFATGCDLTAFACPGDAGASQDFGSLDCAGGGAVVLLATFQPVEALNDLIGIDAILDIEVAGDVTTSANFWDLESANSSALHGTHLRPTIGCSTPTSYQNTWNENGAQFGAIALVRTPSKVRIAAICTRPDGRSVTPNQRMFGFQITIDEAGSVEGGGATLGCPLPGSIILTQLTMTSASGVATTPMTSGSSAGNCVVFNGAFGGSCFLDPVARHTWGQLKSLYR